MNVDLEVVSSPVAGTMSDLPVYLMLQIVPDSQYICVGVIEIKLHHSTVLALILKRESHKGKITIGKFLTFEKYINYCISLRV